MGNRCAQQNLKTEWASTNNDPLLWEQTHQAHIICDPAVKRIHPQQHLRQPRVEVPAYSQNYDCKQSLYIPVLPPPMTTGVLSLLFPLLDVSGSMHVKLQNAKEQICSQFLDKIQPNIVGLVACTAQQHEIVALSGVLSDADTMEYKKAIQSVFIPSHSGSDLISGIHRFLTMLDSYLQQVPSRIETDLWKAECVIITDGIHKVEEAQWRHLVSAVAMTRQLAKSKRCILFFHLLKLQPLIVDEHVLGRLAQVLRAERERRVTIQPMDVFHAFCRHMLLLEKCVSELHAIKRDHRCMPLEAKFTEVLKVRFQLARMTWKDNKQEIKNFQKALKEFEEESKVLFKSSSLLRDEYQQLIRHRYLELTQNVETLQQELFQEKARWFQNRLSAYLGPRSCVSSSRCDVSTEKSTSIHDCNDFGSIRHDCADCMSGIKQHVVRRILPLALAHAKELHCPSGCGNLTWSRTSAFTGACAQCNGEFCLQCGSAPHPSMPDCRRFLQKQFEQKKDECTQALRAQLATLTLLEKERAEIRVCPSCRFAYQKVSGCDTMRCGKCGHYFKYNASDPNQIGHWCLMTGKAELIRVQKMLSTFSVSFS